jgi:hypothetical protein
MVRWFLPCPFDDSLVNRPTGAARKGYNPPCWMEGTMLLAEPIFACIVGIAAVALVVVTAPIWTAAASQLSQLIVRLFARAGETVDESIYGDNAAHGDDVPRGDVTTDKDDEVKP